MNTQRIPSVFELTYHRAKSLKPDTTIYTNEMADLLHVGRGGQRAVSAALYKLCTDEFKILRRHKGDDGDTVFVRTKTTPENDPIFRSPKLKGSKAGSRTKMMKIKELAERLLDLAVEVDGVALASFTTEELLAEVAKRTKR